MHTIYYNTAHISFDNTWIKNANRNVNITLRNNDDFYIPPVNLEMFRKIPLYSFAKAWNELGDSKFQSNPFSFAHELNYKLRENSLSALSVLDLPA